MTIQKSASVLALFFALFLSTTYAASTQYGIDVSSFWGGSGDNSAIYGSAFLRDGTIVLAGIIGDKKVAGIDETVLNTGKASSAAAVVRLASDGKSVLSVTRVAGIIVDMAIDGNENLYLACMGEGVIVIDNYATTVLHTQKFEKNVHRVDASKGGTYAVLTAPEADQFSQKIANATIFVFNSSHTQLGSFGGNSHYTRDVCIDESTQTVITVGFKNYYTDGYPVDVPAYQGVNYNGARKYNGYNYVAGELNQNGSNMADARGHRCVIGGDGNLYMVFEVDGGNFVFDNNPFDVMQNVILAGGDSYHQANNVGTEPSLFYGRYDPSDGAYIKGQFFTNRLDNGRGNTVRIKNGALSVDDDGYMYLCGTSASGMPLTFDPTGGYTGGAYILIVKPDFSGREFCSRLSSGMVHTVSTVKQTDGSKKILWAGKAENSDGYSMYLRQPLQNSFAGAQNGFFALISNSTGTAGNTAPVIDFTVTQMSGTTLEFNAGASFDPDGDALEYIWGFNDGPGWTEGVLVQHTYPDPIVKTYRVALTIIDQKGGWANKILFFGPPTSGFSMFPRCGQAPLSIDFDGARTTDPNDELENLNYSWAFDETGTASGQTVRYTFSNPGIYHPTLTVTDNMAGRNSHEEFILIAADESKARRFDFGSPTDAKKGESGFTIVGPEQYTAAKGYGFARVSTDMKAAGWDYPDKLCADAVQFGKYLDPAGEKKRFDGEFMVDLPNGTYTVLAHFMQKYSYGFSGVEAEGSLVIENVYAAGVSSGPGQPQVNHFTVTVNDGQLNIVFKLGSGDYGLWFVSGLQIIPGEYEPQAVHSQRAPSLRPSNQNILFNSLIFDLSGRLINKSIGSFSSDLGTSLKSGYLSNHAQGVYIRKTSRDSRTDAVNKTILVLP